MDYRSFKEQQEMMQELMSQETGLERRTEIITTLQDEVGHMHGVIDLKTESETKKDEEIKELVKANGILYRKIPATYNDPAKKEEIQKTERQEKLSKISIGDMLNNSNN